MKKIIFFIIILLILLPINKLPDDAIRLRIIANSNEKKDQDIKNIVKESVENDISNILYDSKTSEETEKKIVNNLKHIELKIKKVLQKEQYTLGYSINFGYNYFPKKVLNGVTYDEGEYKSLVISLGEGKGDNWWCILFPPLCLIEAEESNEEVEYDFFLKRVLEIFN